MRLKQLSSAALITLIATAAIPAAPAQASPASSYTSTIAADPNEAGGSGGLSHISDSGYVAGAIHNFDQSQNWVLSGQDPVIWTPTDGVVTGFPKVNEAGHVAYAVADDTTGSQTAQVLRPNGTIDDRGLDPTWDTAVGGIDEDGSIGISRTSPGCYDPEAGPCERQIAVVDDQGNLSDRDGDFDEGVTYAVTNDLDSGWLAGALVYPDRIQPVRWAPNGNREDLELPEGSVFGTALGINGTGEAVGYAADENGTFHALRWDDEGNLEFLDENGTANGSAAYDISDDGTVGGTLGGSGGPDPAPVLWDAAGNLTELNDVTDPVRSRSGVLGVNNHGRAVGQQINDDTGTKAVRWDPVGVELVSIAVTPVAPSLPFGDNTALTATGTYADSSTEDLTGTVTWASTNPTVATVDSAGIVTGVGIGSTTITATSGSVQGTTTVTVTKAPVNVTAVPATRLVHGFLFTQVTITYSATVTSAVTGAPVAGTNVTFTVGSNTACSAVTNGAGVATCEGQYSTLAGLLALLFPQFAGQVPPNPGSTYTATSATTALYLAGAGNSAVG